MARLCPSWLRMIGTAIPVLLAVAATGQLARGREAAVDFGRPGIGAAPQGFDFWQSGGGQPGKWVIVGDKSIGALAIEQSNPDRSTERRYPLAVYRDLSIRNVEFSVPLRPVSGR